MLTTEQIAKHTQTMKTTRRTRQVISSALAPCADKAFGVIGATARATTWHSRKTTYATRHLSGNADELARCAQIKGVGSWRSGERLRCGRAGFFVTLPRASRRFGVRLACGNG